MRREELCTIRWFSSLPSSLLIWVTFIILSKSNLPMKYSYWPLGILWQYLIPLFVMVLIISIKLQKYLLIQCLMNSLQTAKFSPVLSFLGGFHMWYVPQSDSENYNKSAILQKFMDNTGYEWRRSRYTAWAINMS